MGENSEAPLERGEGRRYLWHLSPPHQNETKIDHHHHPMWCVCLPFQVDLPPISRDPSPQVRLSPTSAQVEDKAKEEARSIITAQNGTLERSNLGKL